MKDKKSYAFTLAEILITLTIIGIVASLTIPSLINSINEQQYKIAWKKTYSDFAQAARKLALDQSGDLSSAFGGTLDHNNFRDAFLPYLNYVKSCNAKTPTGTDGCWPAANSWYMLSGEPYSDYKNYARAVLSNGTLVIFGLNSVTCSNSYSPNSDNCGWVNFDVNGFSKPNRVGVDIFRARILRYGNIIPAGTQGDVSYGVQADECDPNTPNTQGWNCSAKYLYQ